MYKPRAFREENPGRLNDFIVRHSFGTLVVATATGELDIAHVPVVIDRSDDGNTRLRLHVAAANSIWRASLAAGRVAVVFAGPHGYVSANWYEQPSEQVPTWNYAVVHAHGTPHQLDRDELIQLLDDLVLANEKGETNAWQTSLLSSALRDELLLQIVGLSIAVTSLDGKFKLSQNRSETDRLRVIDALRRRAGQDDIELVELMTHR